MVRRKGIFISFDFDHARHYAYLLTALAKNPLFDIDFEDRTPREIRTIDISRVKAGLTRRIRDATHTLVVVGAHANSNHPDRYQIGERNWQHWEIMQSIAERNGLIAVKIKPNHSSPTVLYGQGAHWAMSFNVTALAKAINEG